MASGNHQDQLAWVQRNRTRIPLVKPVGTIIAGWVDASLDGGSKQAEKLAELISSVVDDEFRRHARVHVGEDKQVFVVVDRAELMFSTRTRWHQRLAKALQSSARFAGCKLAYRHGEFGVRVPQAASPQPRGK